MYSYNKQYTIYPIYQANFVNVFRLELGGELNRSGPSTFSSLLCYTFCCFNHSDNNSNNMNMNKVYVGFRCYQILCK